MGLPGGQREGNVSDLLGAFCGLCPAELVNGDNSSSCRACKLADQCQQAGGDARGLSGGALVAWAAGCFLAPVAAAIAAAVAVPGQVARLIAAVAAGAATAGAVAVGAWAARRRRGLS